ncbi:hypothetical protein F4561_000884 [Lipingzhangella halophila]|uniref:Calpain catalytic domain-containing protein n=1 Tax=Lipingzhangella halophila TaxID=1783352 RepID=A0A7W7RDM3_9ACTN|nr:C2 family cysteine protease [Lipingzhangella halophila]MBB4930064.1 hypothetical protein [Lipingzhangella halophila]
MLLPPHPPESASDTGDRPSLGDRGAGYAEYAAGLALVAGITAAVLTTGVNTEVRDLIDGALCQVAENESCDDAPAANSDDHTGPGPGQNGEDSEGDNTSRPSDEQLEAVEDEVQEIRDYLNSGLFDWWWGPDHPSDIMDDMSPAELRALYWSLSDDEIRELLSEDDVRDLTLRRADLDTLRRLQDIAPAQVGPDFDDVNQAEDAKKDEDVDYDPTWGEVEGGQLYGDDGEISSDDLDQGSLGNCWWLAGTGAIADQNPEMIKDMIQENSNGTYTVTFGDGESVTVTPDIVVDADSGGAVFSDPGHEGVMWPAILEKAHAQREGSYGETEGGNAADSLEMVTGNDAEEIDAGDVTEADLNSWLEGDDPHAVTVASLREGDGKDPYKNGDLAERHVYVVEEVNDGKVELTNPWGHSHATLTIDEFNEFMREVDVAPTG